MKIRMDFVTNSSSQSYIAISIKNPELARLCKEYKINLRVKGDTVSYKYDDLEGGAYSVIPEAGDFVDWFLHFIKDEDVADYAAYEQIELNRKNIEDALIKSTIVVSRIDEAGGCYWEERRTKDEIELKGFDDRSWNNVWNSVSRDEIAELYDGYDIEFASPENYPLRQMISDNWGIQSKVNKDAFFKNMMDKYGTIRVSANEKKQAIQFINPELDFFKSREVDPDTIDFAGKTVCLVDLDPSEKMPEYFSKEGGLFNAAKRMIEDLGGRATKSVSGKTDYVIIQEKMSEKYIYKNPRNTQNNYNSYCEIQKMERAIIEKYDEKREAKGRPEIRVIFEDIFYGWLKKIYEEMKSDAEIPIEMTILKGMTFAAAGFSDSEETEIAKSVELNGGVYLYNFSSGLNYLVYNPDCAEEPLKMKKARLLEKKGETISFITVNDYYRMLSE